MRQEIRRDKYLQELIDRKENGLIKVITGLRRVGKSYLLFHLYQNYLLESGVPKDHIISLILDDDAYTEYQNPKKILSYIRDCVLDGELYFVFIDEVQLLENFELVLNTLLHQENLDIYVIGSNSKFLSKDVITEFRGRGDEIHVYPLSFAEYVSVYQGSVQAAWSDYYTFGGLPLILSRKSDEQKSIYLANLFRETYLKDILSRNRIDNPDVLDTLLDIVSSSVGSLTNPKRIADSFRSVEGITLSPVTVKKYLGYLEDAFLIREAKRFDVKGRKYIGTPLKYYFEDVGLRNVRLNFRQQEETHILENIIYIELLRRGFSVDVGVVERSERLENGLVRKYLEIDFVANLGSRRYYIQSAFSISGLEKMMQEKRSLLLVGDSFKKIIIVRDEIKLKRDEDGIVTMSVFDFLLDEGSLDR